MNTKTLALLAALAYLGWQFTQCSTFQMYPICPKKTS